MIQHKPSSIKCIILLHHQLVVCTMYVYPQQTITNRPQCHSLCKTATQCSAQRYKTHLDAVYGIDTQSTRASTYKTFYANLIFIIYCYYIKINWFTLNEHHSANAFNIYTSIICWIVYRSTDNRGLLWRRWTAEQNTTDTKPFKVIFAQFLKHQLDRFQV